MMNEVWKSIPGHPGYEVSNYGRVRSGIKGSHLLSIHKDWNGYLKVTLGRFGRNKRVHRLVLEAFIGPCPVGCQCDHINTVRTDNRLENLRWATESENKRNPITQERHRHQKGNRAVVCVETGEVFASVSEAARRTGMDAASISGVCHRKYGRRHVGGLTFRFVEDAQ